MKNKIKVTDIVKIVSVPIIENNPEAQVKINKTLGRNGQVTGIFNELSGRNIMVAVDRHDSAFYNLENLIKL